MPTLSRQYLQDLADHCAEETHDFFQNGQNACASCLTLFKRAVLEQDEDAWELIYRQYEPLVKGWVLRHPAFLQTGEEADFFVNVAFSRMWQAITPEKCEGFNDIKSALRYLQACTHSAILDSIRQQRSEWLDIDASDVQRQIDAHAAIPNIEDRVQHRIYCKQALIAIQKRMKTPKEHYVLHEMFVLGLKPSEIIRKHPGVFRDVQEIYRIKENILARLRRDKELQKYLA